MKTPVLWDMVLCRLVYKCQISCEVYRVVLRRNPARSHLAGKRDTLIVWREFWEMYNGRNIVGSLNEIRKGNLSVLRLKNEGDVWAKLEISSFAVI